MKTTIYTCDIKDCNNPVKKENISKSLQILFVTEQTEGRGCSPYLVNVKLDICESCLGRILSGTPLYGAGAMGFNKYFF